MGDITSGIEMAIWSFVAFAIACLAMTYGLCLWMGWRPLSWLGGVLGI